MKENYAVLGLFSLISTVYCQSPAIVRACGQFQPLRLTSAQGNIYSPGYESKKPYPPNSECSYYIDVPSTRNLLLEIKYMDLEATDNCVRDYVQVADYVRGLLIGKFCGSNITEKILIGSGQVRIEFSSDGIVSGRGFHIAYQFTTMSTLCKPRELQCKNNKCVVSANICNLKDDCGDGSDEENCRKKLNQKADCGVPRIPPVLDTTDRIVGGQIAVPGSWPWQADLQIIVMHPNGHQCGGSLINSQWVVTALHCFTQFRNKDAWRIHLGNHHKFSRDPSEQIRYAKELYFYNNSFPNDEQELMDHDIALIKLNAEVKFTDDVSPICLPPVGFKVPIGTKCYSSGWGHSRGSGGSDVLKQTIVTVIDSKKCENPVAKINDKTMICTDEHDGNGGICHGDSGGPLMCEVNKKWYLVGISSFGTDISLAGGLCGIQNIPTVYQKVSSKLQWIESTIKRYG